MTALIDDLLKLGQHLDKKNEDRYKAVSKERTFHDIERIIKNHALNMVAAAKACGMNRVTFKAKYDEAVKLGVIDEVLKPNSSSYLFTLKHMHALMDWLKLPKWSDKNYETHVINSQNQKGGTGKSTTLITLAAGLSLLLGERLKILVIDLDPQGSLRKYLLPHQEYAFDILTAVDIMLGEDESDGLYQEYLDDGLSHEEILKSSIHETHIPNLHVLPSFSEDERFSQAAWMHFAKTGDLKHVKLLKEKIINSVKDDYDVIFLDTGPHINPLVWSAQYASTGMLVPFSPKELDWHSTSQFLRNLPHQLMQTLPNKGENIEWLKVLATNCNAEFNRDQKVLSASREALASGEWMFPARMINSQAFEAAAQNNCTVFDIKKVEKLCPDKQLDKIKPYTDILINEFLGFIESKSKVKADE